MYGDERRSLRRMLTNPHICDDDSKTRISCCTSHGEAVHVFADEELVFTKICCAKGNVGADAKSLPNHLS